MHTTPLFPNEGLVSFFLVTRAPGPHSTRVSVTSVSSQALLHNYELPHVASETQL